MNQENVQSQVIPIILGPTASGKTKLAVALAKQLNGEIISADSRQVYRGMNIGTGKDYEEYIIDNQQIKYHLIDILDAGEKYDVSRFKTDCLKAITDIQSRNKTPIICGGTGLYVEALLRDFTTFDVPPNEELRKELLEKSTEELLEILNRISPNHEVDISTRKRIIRGIEVFSVNNEQLTIINNRAKTNVGQKPKTQNLKPIPIAIGNKLFCLNPPVELRREKITKRLRQRIDNEGLIEEVEDLLNSGITPEQLIYYGLEYKFITEYLQGNGTKEELFERLNTAIHRFAKRQMTFFRSMEKRGLEINWISGDLSTEERLKAITLQLF
ncbi:MAG: tRNA (adenosine(37)-N6)-dimethylallyltransferase MiaA [Spirosomaceae bacterium]|nr:tRNA (adenosine(37)-N6)-dimethylallyltransferase MiaA [Spirosomataceae bacterium]